MAIVKLLTEWNRTQQLPCRLFTSYGRLKPQGLSDLLGSRYENLKRDVMRLLKGTKPFRSEELELAFWLVRVMEQGWYLGSFSSGESLPPEQLRQWIVHELMWQNPEFVIENRRLVAWVIREGLGITEQY